MDHQDIRKISKISIKEEKLSNIELSSQFFDIFREAYGSYFNEWWYKHINDTAYVVNENSNLVGFLKLKIEYPSEDYGDINPILDSKKRLKISSLKVDKHIAPAGLGKRFMRTIMSKALEFEVTEIYGTLAINSSAYDAVKHYLEKWGFKRWGSKLSHGVQEDVFINSDSLNWSKTMFDIDDNGLD